MTGNEELNWYSIRTIYHWGRKKNGKYVFEERIVVFSGKTWDDAWKKAKRESKSYAKKLGYGPGRYYAMHEGYRTDGDALIDGYEVWSELNETELNIQKFYAAKYSRFKYKYQPRM